jgi:hypothetical protein
MSHMQFSSDVSPRFDGHVWRDKYGTVHATVDLDARRNYLSFGNPADARALAAECIKAAEAMERFEAEAVTSAPPTPVTGEE